MQTDIETQINVRLNGKGESFPIGIEIKHITPGPPPEKECKDLDVQVIAVVSQLTVFDFTKYKDGPSYKH